MIKMKRKIIYVGLTCLSFLFTACKTPLLPVKNINKSVPVSFNNSQDNTNSANIKWKDYFNDRYLAALIDTALSNNQELNILLQEIEISKNEVMARKGEYMPFVNIRGGAGFDKVGRYTSKGSSEATTEIKPGKETPDPLPEFGARAYASWEVDIWHKLRNAKKAAMTRYLASIEGKNFMVTNLIAEIANSYYELQALDNQLSIVRQNIEIQSNALRIVKLEKESTRVTELAVKKFEAEVLSTKSLEFTIKQEIIEAESRINFLVGRYPQPILRNSDGFNSLVTDDIHAGIPSELLQNRPDIKQAELQLAAARLDIAVAKANFYPSLGISASLGLQAFNPIYLAKLPESLLTSLASDMVGPLVNKNAIRATYFNANASQIQAIYNYERTLLQSYIEVANQLSKVGNLKRSYELKEQEVQALTESITISNKLFRSARADYMEVLLTQRDALESRFELVETKREQMNAVVNIYQALGGGWN